MNSLLSLAKPARRLPSIWLWLVCLWLLVLIATPLSIWLMGSGIFPWMASLGVLVQAATVIFGLAQDWQPGRIFRVVLVIIAFTLTVEWVGITTGSPFGPYSYTNVLQPQFLGVPLLIPLAWLMMIVPAWGVSEAILGRRRARLGKAYWMVFAAISGLAFTAWDLYLDPQMTRRDLWIWQSQGGYFGIPWQNFAGWWLASFFLTLLVQPRSLPLRPLLIVYTLTWAFQAVGLGVFWRQPGPAAAGFAGMGIFVWLAWKGLRHEKEFTL
jgi:uncharacterized membrane protein